MKDAIAVSFYTCDFETHKQERIDDPCGKWLWEWIGIEPEIPPEWYASNSTTYTNYQLEYISLKESEILTGAEEDVIQCEANRVVATPTVEPGWTLRVTTDLNQITSSSDYQITDNRKSTQLTVNFNADGGGGSCELLPRELFNKVIYTNFILRTATTGQWEINIEKDYTPSSVTWGTYGLTVNFDADYSLGNFFRWNIQTNLPEQAEFWPVFEETIPDSVINRISPDFNWDWSRDTSAFTYEVVAIEFYSVDDNVYGDTRSLLDRSQSPTYVGQFPLYYNPPTTPIANIVPGRDWTYFDEYAPAFGSAEWGILPQWGEFEVRVILLSSGFESGEHSIVADVTPDLPGGLNFNPVYLNNTPGIASYQNGTDGLVKASDTFFIPVHLPSYVVTELAFEAKGSGRFYHFRLKNISDLPVSVYAVAYVISENGWNQTEKTVFVNLPASMENFIDVYISELAWPAYYYTTRESYLAVLLTEQNGTHSTPINLPEFQNPVYDWTLFNFDYECYAFYSSGMVPLVNQVLQPDRRINQLNNVATPVTINPPITTVNYDYSPFYQITSDSFYFYWIWDDGFNTPGQGGVQFASAELYTIYSNLGIQDSFKINVLDAIGKTPGLNFLKYHTVYHPTTLQALTGADVFPLITAAAQAKYPDRLNMTLYSGTNNPVFGFYDTKDTFYPVDIVPIWKNGIRTIVNQTGFEYYFEFQTGLNP